MSVEQFAVYLANLNLSAWKPELVVIHHTAAPSLAQRPDGFTSVHMQNLKSYYGSELGWSAGPHLFVDDHQLWVFSPMTRKGVHAVSFNRNSWGIEMLGDYDTEDPTSGRGLAVLQNAAKATKVMLGRICKDVSAIRFHRDDPKTKKTCPGKRVKKESFIELVRRA